MPRGDGHGGGAQLRRARSCATPRAAACCAAKRTGAAERTRAAKRTGAVAGSGAQEGDQGPGEWTTGTVAWRGRVCQVM